MNNRIRISEGESTPWGTAEIVTELGPGIYFARTPSHGGMHLSPELNNRIPWYFRNKSENGWYEEDCAAAIPPFILGIEAFSREHTRQFILSGEAEETVKNWYPNEWELYTHKTLQPGESSTRDHDNYMREHEHDLLVICARGDWYKDIPKGFVAATATIGGLRAPNTPIRCFLIPSDEYTGYVRHPFLIDPAKYQEIPNIER